MKVSLYPPLTIHEIGKRDNQEDALSLWENRLFVLCGGMLEQMKTMELGSYLCDPYGEEDENKRDRLIAATANNQDNHSAWLIHIKDVINEKGDNQLVNEKANFTLQCRQYYSAARE